MRCSSCGQDTKVIDSREAPAGTRRRRECLACGARFTTREVLEEHAAKLAELERVRAMLRETAGLLEAAAKVLDGAPPVPVERLGKPGRPRETGAHDYERCADCGALVWRGELATHECPRGVSAAAAERLAQELMRRAG